MILIMMTQVLLPMLFPHLNAVEGEEGLCILVKRFSYPIRHRGMAPRFGLSGPELSMIAVDMTNLLFNMYHHEL